MRLKSIARRCLRAVAPRAALTIEAARARAHSQRVIAGWGCGAVNDALIGRFGDRVLSGPFAGMALTPMTRQEQLGPYLLGTYEAELHPAWNRLLQGRYSQVIDVGAKFGYYAVGLALRFPETPVVAFDTDPWARRALREMIAENGVTNVNILKACDRGWLAANLRPGALILSDCEGYEGELFGSVTIPELVSATLVIETHETLAPGTIARLRTAIGATHDLEEILSDSSDRAVAVDLSFLDDRRRALATHEVRSEQLYLVGTPRRGQPAR
jgi:hypothetical protein